MEIKKISLGQKIKRYRLVNDIRQEDMAEKMGISRATLINYEKGHTTINIDVLNRLKNYYPDFVRLVPFLTQQLFAEISFSEPLNRLVARPLL